MSGIILTRCPECAQLTYDARTDDCFSLRDCDLCGGQWICADQACPCRGNPTPPWGD